MKSKLQTQQNVALRAVLKVDLSYPSQQLLTETGLDSIRTDMAKDSCKMVFKGFYDLSPAKLNDMFCLYVRERNTSYYGTQVFNKLWPEKPRN